MEYLDYITDARNLEYIRGYVGSFTATQRIRGILAQFRESDVDVLFQKDEIKRHIEKPQIQHGQLQLQSSAAALRAATAQSHRRITGLQDKVIRI
jgi:hypothetical protein